MGKVLGTVELLNKGNVHTVPIFNALPETYEGPVLVLEEPVREETTMAVRTANLYRDGKSLAEFSLLMEVARGVRTFYVRT